MGAWRERLEPIALRRAPRYRVVIPAYSEAAARAPRHAGNVVVVDDGANDGTTRPRPLSVSENSLDFQQQRRAAHPTLEI